MMEKSSPRSIVPVCPLTHSLLGKLQVILGYCDLLVERHSQDSESSNHLQLIRQAVQSMGVELHDYQCELIVQQRITAERKREALT
jgi:hypothetical protein